MAVNKTLLESTTSALTSEGQFFELETLLQPNGNSVKTYKHAAKDLIEILEAGRQHGDADLFVYQDERISFNAFFKQVDAFRAIIAKQFDFQSGDIIAIAMRNYPEWAVAFCATVISGGIAVPLNSWGKSDELLFGINDSDAKLIVCDDERYQLLKPNRQDITAEVIVARVEQSYPDDSDYALSSLIDAGKGLTVPPSKPADPHSTAMVLYTSGSTGFPKGVPLTHIGSAQTLFNMYFIGAFGMALDAALPAAETATGKTPSTEPDTEEKPHQEASILTIPLFHATGLFSSFLLSLQLGHKLVLMYKWDVEKALALIESEYITRFSSVPAIVQALLTSPKFDDYDTSSINTIGSGGAASPPGLSGLIKEKLNATTGNGWGMTETTSLGASLAGPLTHARAESVGLISPIIELRTVDADDQAQSIGDEGEIECRGITVTEGYWNRPDATAEVLNDGWMKTGDIGVIDDWDILTLTGRKKELVIRGGENIFPPEIELATHQHPSIQEVVVFGVPDDKLGEELALVYYAEGDDALSEKGLRDFLTEKLARFKVPRYIQREQQRLAKNVSSKLNKKVIRGEFIQTL